MVRSLFGSGGRPPHEPATEAAAASDLDTVYAREAPKLARFFRYRLGRPDEVADLVQESFLRLVGSSARHNIANPAAYLNRIARNLLFDRARGRSERDPGASETPIDEMEIAVRPEQADQLETEQVMRVYQAAVDALPPRTREVFILQRVDDMSYKAIAHKLGIGVRTVEWHMAEALMRIRRTLDAHG